MDKKMFLFSGCKDGKKVKERRINKILFKKNCVSRLL